jgi:type IV fimbrial biogenesis protein FimT
MNRNNGFTLIELMVTLAVAAILLTVGIPSFKEMISNNRLTTQSNALVGFLQGARMEAVRRNRTVSVCVDDNLGSDACDGTDWAQGWRLWIDLDGDNNVDADETLRVKDGILGTTTIVSAGFDNTESISFSSTGEADSTGTFTICDSDRAGEPGVAISISTTGRISSAPPSPACS